ncbi:MAG: hypothetical protein NDJ89_02370 [Oligoflexia bacterium]|nr:hypothetical protein [Oligoflexia bacterium]
MSRISKIALIMISQCIALSAHAEGEPHSLFQCVRSFANIFLHQKDTRVPDPLLAENLERLPYVKEKFQALSSDKEFRHFTLVNPSRQAVLRGSDFESLLSPAELSAIDHYSRSGYKAMNGTLRSGGPCEGECQVFREAIGKLPSYEGIVFRRLVFKNGEIPPEYLSDAPVFSEKGFSSAYRKTDTLAAASHEKEFLAAAAARRMGGLAGFTPNVDTLANSGPGTGEVLMVIRSHSGRSIEGGANLRKLESEVVFDAGTSFKKMKVQKTGRGGYLLFLEEIRP